MRRAEYGLWDRPDSRTSVSTQREHDPDSRAAATMAVNYVFNPPTGARGTP